LRSSSQASLVQATPLAQEGVTVVSDEEATQSGSGLKRRPSLSKSKALVGETAGVSTRSEHTLSSKGPLLQEGSSNVCCSFRDSQFNHRAHSRAHNVFDGDLHCLLNQEVDTIQEDIDRFLHKTEVSVAALCDKLSRVSVLEKDWLAELALTKTHLIAAKEEVARLSKEVDGLQGLKVKLRARGEDNRAGDWAAAGQRSVFREGEILASFGGKAGERSCFYLRSGIRSCIGASAAIVPFSGHLGCRC